jgi:hypothetical protein
VQALDTLLVELLPATEERDRVVDRHVPAFEPRDDLLELALELLERSRLGQGRSSSTRAPTAPYASSTSRWSPVRSSAALRIALPPARTIA